MAQHVRRQSEWPIVKREPDAYVLVPDVYTRTDRAATGPLRNGTVPNGAGPSGKAPQDASDYGMDRVSPRCFDPLGTGISRYSNPKRDAELISSRPAPRSSKRGSGSGHD